MQKHQMECEDSRCGVLTNFIAVIIYNNVSEKKFTAQQQTMNRSVRVSNSIHPQNDLFFLLSCFDFQTIKYDRNVHSRADVFITEFQR